MDIIIDDLVDWGSCEGSISLFEEIFPDGTDVTQYAFEKAREAGLPIEFAMEKAPYLFHNAKHLFEQSFPEAFYYERYVEKLSHDEIKNKSYSNPRRAYEYQMHYKTHLFLPEVVNQFRTAVCTSPKWAYLFALNVDKHSNPATRRAACGDPCYAELYARLVDKHPRDDTREGACLDPRSAYLYARHVDKQPRDDTRAASCLDSKSAYQYAFYLDKHPRDDTRAAASRDPEWAYRYAEIVDEQSHDDTRLGTLGSETWNNLYRYYIDKETTNEHHSRYP